MKEILLTAELVVAILLGVSILLQPKNAGMGSMGGEDETQSFSTKRGAEKVLHIASLVLAAIFGIIGFAFPFFA